MNKRFIDSYRALYGKNPPGYEEQPKPTEARREREASLKGKADRGEVMSPADSSQISGYILQKAQDKKRLAEVSAPPVPKQPKPSEQRREREALVKNKADRGEVLAPADSALVSPYITTILENRTKQAELRKPAPVERKGDRTTTKAGLEFAGKREDIQKRKDARSFELKRKKGKNGKVETVQDPYHIFSEDDPTYKDLVKMDKAYADSTKLKVNMENMGLTNFDMGLELLTDLEKAMRQYQDVENSMSKEYADRWVLKDMGMTIDQIRKKINAFKR